MFWFGCPGDEIWLFKVISKKGSGYPLFESNMRMYFDLILSLSKPGIFPSMLVLLIDS